MDSTVNRSLSEQLQDLVASLLQIGRDRPNALIIMAEIAQPELTEHRAVEILGKMFKEVPPILQQSPQQLYKLIEDPPAETLRLLLDLRDIQKLFNQMSITQLFTLCSNQIPPGSLDYQLQYMKSVQEAFQNWDIAAVDSLHFTIVQAPLHMERRVLMEKEQRLPWEILNFLVLLLKLPTEELHSFYDWFTKLSPRSLQMLIKILQLEPDLLLELKQTFEPIVEMPLTQSATSILPQAHFNPSVSVGSTESNFSADSRAPKRPRSLPPDKLEIIDGSLSYPPFEMPGESPWLPDGSILSTSTNTMQTLSQLQSANLNLTHTNSNNNNNNNNNIALQSSHPSFVNSTSPFLIPNAHPTLTSSIANTPPSLRFSNPALGISTGDVSNYTLRVVRQPPDRTVYQRMLKNPYPTVMLVGGGANSAADVANNNFFVEATLIRADSESELPLCLDGQRRVKVSNGCLATFKKLKILNTSQQIGTLFRLKFSLQKYLSNTFETLQGATAISEPVEVFSHSLYLEKKAGNPTPPVIGEIIPALGTPGQRLCLLGSNFVNSPHLVVKFGEVSVVPKFHEAGTLIVERVPPPQVGPLGYVGHATGHQGQLAVPVKVANDGVNFCESKCFFTYVIM